MENSKDPGNIDVLNSIGKHLKSIAELQEQQNQYLRNISAVLTFLTIAVVLILVALFIG